MPGTTITTWRGAVARRRAALAAVAAAGVVLAACGSRHPGSPRPTSVTPDFGSQDVPVVVRIRGEGFAAQVGSDFTGGGGGVMDARFQARLGDTPLDDVALQQDGSIVATVPVGLPAGTYALTVVAPDGSSGTLAGAYRVVVPGATVRRNVSYRVDAVGPQVAFQPFTVVVTAVDAAGEVVTDVTGSLALSDRSGAVVPARVGLLSRGRWTGPVEVRAPHARDVLTVTDAEGGTGSSEPFAVAPAPAAGVRLDAQAAAAAAGLCVGPLTLSLADAFGQPTVAAVDTALAVDAVPAAGFTLHADAACATPAPSPVIAAGRGAVSVWFTAAAAGPLQISASGTSLAGAAQAWSVAAGAPAGLAFVSAPQTVVAGACSAAAAVEVRDAFGNPSPDGVAALTFAAAPAGAVRLFSDAACTTPATSLPVPGGATRATFHFSGTAAGPVTVGAAAPGLAGASQDEAVTAAAPAVLAFLTPARAAAAGGCSPPLTVEVRDAFGNPAPGAAIAVALAAAPGAAFAFHGDAACSRATTAVAIPAGTARATFHYRGTARRDVAVTASAAGLGAAAQTERVDPAAAASLAFASAPQTVTVHGCSGAVVLAVLDAFGNASPVSSELSVPVSASPPEGFGLFSDAACAIPAAAATIPAGGDAAVFHFSDSQVGPITLTASPPSLSAATQGESVVAGAADRLAFATAEQTVQAGTCSGPATVESRDRSGNPSPASATLPTTVTLSGAGLAFHAGAGCGGAAVTAVVIAAGATSATFSFSGTTAGSVSVSAAGGALSPASQTETLTPGRAARLAFATAAQTAAAGTCSGAVTVQAQDAHGNPSAVSPSAPTAVALTGAGLTFHAGAGCGGAPVTSLTLAAGATSTTFSFEGTSAGSFAVTAAAGTLAAATQTETVVAAAPSRLVFTTAAQSVEAGTCSGVVAVQAQDGSGNPSAPSASSATGVALSGGGVWFYAGAGCTGGAVTAASIPAGGTSATFSFRSSAAGSVTVTATSGALGPATQVETVVAAAATQLVFTTAAQMVQAGTCSAAATVQAQDGNGNPSPPSAASATGVTLSGGGLAFYAGPGCGGGTVTAVSIPAGATSATFSFRGGAATAVMVTAAAGALTPAAQSETVVAAAASQLVFTSAAQTVVAGECSGPAAVEARDGQGNPSAPSASSATAVTLSGDGVSFYAMAGCGGGEVTAVSIPAGGTSTTFSFRSDAATPVTITAASGALAPATQTETVVAGTATRLAFTTAAQTVQAGSCSGVATVQAQDGNGNPSAPSASSTAVTLSGGDLGFYAGPGCSGGAVTAVSIPAGATSATFSFRGTVAGAVTVSAGAGGLGAAAQLETVAAAPATQVAFTTAAQTVQAGACAPGAVAVQAQDIYGNPSPPSSSAGTPVTLSGAGLTFYAGAGCAGAGTTQVAIAAGATTVAFSFRGTAAGTVTVTATASGVGSRTQDQTILAAALDHLAWTTVASPRTSGLAFAVGLTAVDAHGNLASYTGTATLAASPGSVRCATSCTSASTTAAFTGGRWIGAVTVPSAATGVTLTATAAGCSGVSNAFDVQAGPALRSPPLATFRATPRVAISGAPITFDASGSSDYQTAAADLQVSWDFTAATAADLASPAAPAAGNWTAWTNAKTASHTMINTGASAVVVRPRLAVRDTEAGPGGPDLGYAAGLVVVLPNGTDLCTVDTASLADDGASDCYTKGPDGKLSLTEAVRLANGWPRTLNITFGDPMVIASTAKLSLTRAVRILGVPGVVLDGVSFDVAHEDVLLSGLEIEHLTTTITVRGMGLSDAVFEDLFIHDGAGILVQGGNARLRNVTMSGCAGACVREVTTSSWLGVFGCDFQGTGGVGVSIEGCATEYPGPTSASPYQAWTFGGWTSSGAAGIFASVFTGFDTAVSVGSSSACRYPYLSNLTFDRNAVAVRRSASTGTGGYLYDSVFTRQTVAAVDPAACGFATLARNAAWQNASVGCLVPDVTSDPLHVWPDGRDHRIQYASPLKDAADAGNHVEVDGAGPGLYLGAGPDRGGRETY